jgi:hypothetical protein
MLGNTQNPYYILLYKKNKQKIIIDQGTRYTYLQEISSRSEKVGVLGLIAGQTNVLKIDALKDSTMQFA